MPTLLAVPVLLTAALFAAFWPWTAILDRRPTVRLLAALVAVSTAIVLLQLALGAVDALSPAALRASSLALAALLLGALAVPGWRRTVAPVLPFGGVLRRPTPVGIALGALTLAAYGWLCFVGTLVPPYGWDSLVYHLTDVFHLARSHSLARFAFFSPGGPAFYFPQVGEMHAAWAYILSGAGAESWRVAGFGLIPLALTTGVAARATAEALGLRAGLSWIVPGVMLAPVVAAQPLALYVDVALAAFVLAATAFAALAAAQGRFAHLALAALSAGLAMGVKVSFLYFSATIVVVLANRHVWRLLTGGRWWRAVARVTLAAALFALPCAFWYLRNLLDTGNPLYPFHVKVAGATLFSGPVEVFIPPQWRWFVSSRLGWLAYPFHETFFGKTQYSLENGFGPQFAAGLLATLVMAVTAGARRRWTELRVLLALPVTLALWIAVNPGQEPRYIIAACGVAMVGLAALAEQWPAGAPRLGGTEPAQSPEARWSFVVLEAAVVVALVFSALGAAVASAPEQGRVLASWRRGSWKPTDYYRVEYGTAGDAMNWLSERGAGRLTVCYTNATFIAPYFGWHNSNRVVFAATPDDLRLGSMPRVGSYREWRAFLRAEGVDIVVVWLPWWGETMRDVKRDWIASHPEDFALVEDFGGRAKVYRPIFPAAGAGEEAPAGSASLWRLDLPEAWTLEYATGTKTEVAADPAGGLRLNYQFLTPNNDYCDWRAEVSDLDWSAFPAFSFDLDAAPQATWLILYLKDRDPQQACRFRVDLRQAAHGGRVTLDLARPEWRTEAFVLSHVAEMHLVLDDINDSDAFAGSLRIAGFRLERMQAQSAKTAGPTEATP